MVLDHIQLQAKLKRKGHCFVLADSTPAGIHNSYEDFYQA